VATGYTPYQLIYGLPIEYVLSINGDHKDAEPTRVLIAKIIGTYWKLRTMWESTNGTDF